VSTQRANGLGATKAKQLSRGPHDPHQLARNAIGDSGEDQRLIKTLPRQGFHFVGVAGRSSRGGRRDPYGSTETCPAGQAIKRRPSVCQSELRSRVSHSDEKRASGAQTLEALAFYPPDAVDAAAQ